MPFSGTSIKKTILETNSSTWSEAHSELHMLAVKSLRMLKTKNYLKVQ